GIPNEPWTTSPGVHSPACTYAEAASRGLTASRSHTKMLSSTETPGIIIKITDKNEATETRLKPGSALLEKICQEAPVAEGDIVAVRKLLSGDIHVCTTSKVAKSKMKNVKT